MKYNTLTPIRKYGDPILKEKCLPIERGEDLNWLQELRTLCARHNGAGLAAPQIGILKRAFVVMPLGHGRNFFMINPTIVRMSGEEEGPEGCLSYPGVWCQVKRATGIVVKYYDWTWRQREDMFVSFEARIIQHEYDHLDGVCHVGDQWLKQQELDSLTTHTWDTK